MRNEHHTTSCSPGGFCGTCPTPCFLRGEGDPAFDALVERGPEPEFEQFDSPEDTNSFVLKCARWDDPEAECLADNCAFNYFCFTDYQRDTEGDPA
ncbi:hypothetical protein GCM10022419_016410 [Nonomuraea rosea]|uniref:Uncharacterized protein n=1 Tax=Nonomuraea rosea TaxID=638574 RepID=A0ABP6VKB1_9ACTN